MGFSVNKLHRGEIEGITDYNREGYNGLVMWKGGGNEVLRWVEEMEVSGGK